MPFYWGRQTEHRPLPLCWWAVQVISILWKIEAVVTCAALAILVWRRMYRFYPALVVYVAASGVSDIIGLSVGSPRTMLYLHFWFGSEVLLLVLKILVVWELVRLMFAEYPGIEGFVQLLLLTVTGLAVAFCAVTALPELRSAPWAMREYQIAFMLGRWVTTAMAGLVVGLSVFFGLYGQSGRRNLILHRWAVSAYLIGNALIWFYAEASADRTIPGALRMVLATSCIVAWGNLSPSGERITIPASDSEVAAVAHWNAELIAVGQRVLRSGRERDAFVDKG